MRRTRTNKTPGGSKPTPLSKGLTRQPPRREDWDFYSVPDDELYACQWWEYARESARIRAFYQPAGSDFFQPVGMAPERQRLNRTTKIEAHRRLVDPIRVQFARFLRE